MTEDRGQQRRGGGGEESPAIGDPSPDHGNRPYDSLTDQEPFRDILIGHRLLSFFASSLQSMVVGDGSASDRMEPVVAVLPTIQGRDKMVKNLGE